VILITHIEPVREGLDRVISVGYDADRGCSVVTESEGEAIGLGEELEPVESSLFGRGRARVTDESEERAAGAA